MTIICKACGRELDPSRFYKNNRDGNLQPCKECWKAKYAKSEAGRIAHRQANSRWKKTEAGKASNRRALAKNRKSPAGKRWREEWEAANPDKVQAHFTKYNHSEKGRATRRRHAEKRQYLKQVTQALILFAEEAREED